MIMKEYEFILHYDFLDSKTNKWVHIVLRKSETAVQAKLGTNKPVTVIEAWKAFERSAYMRFWYEKRKGELCFKN
jgi:hypothetical protein